MKSAFPKEYLIDISSLCNHACTSCLNRKMQNKFNISVRFVLRIIKYIILKDIYPSSRFILAQNYDF